MKPTHRALVLAIAGSLFALAPVLVHPNTWTFWPVFVAWFALALGVDTLLAPSRSSVRCEAEIPATIYIGMSDTAELELRLRTRRRIPLEVVVDLSDELEPIAPIEGRCADGRCALELKLTPRRRGTGRVEAVWVRYRGPLGLVVATVRIRLDREVSIVPNILPVRAAAIRFFSDRDAAHGLKVERFKGEGTEFDSLKEFVQGDDPRALDWKATARHRKLLAREHRAERNHQVIIAVDTGHLMAERLGGIPKLDHALNVALLLSYVCIRTGDQVGLFTFDAQVGLFLEPRAGAAAQTRMTQMTSQVRYSDAETNFTLGLTTLAQRVRRRSLVIVLTDFADAVTAELMIENLHRLSRRHLVVFVALKDPALEQLSASRPNGTFALNRTVVADSFVRDREVVLRRLRRMGVRPIDAAPEHIHTDLINGYLDVKRREMV
jgi:uncharacterized protein (DUF58 family)